MSLKSSRWEQRVTSRDDIEAPLLARIAELERRAKLTVGSMPCGGCGGPHRFDTSVPSAEWNEVIRPYALSEYLCASCILLGFVKANRSFTATLWGEGLSGVPIEVRIREKVATDAAAIGEQNTDLRAALFALVEQIDAWNTAVEQVIGRPTGYNWAALARARKLLEDVTR